MDLSVEVEGYIQDKAAKILAWDKIIVFGKRIGIDTKDLQEREKTKRNALQYIFSNAPKDNTELVIATFISMSKFGTYDNDFSAQVISEINPILEKTMSVKTDITGRLIPVFPLLKQKPEMIVARLTSLGFPKSSSFYDQASKAYNISPKGAVSLLRSTFESLIDEVLTSKGVTTSSSYKEKLTQITNLGVLRTLSTTDCTRCHHRREDNEFNLSYDLFGIISYYGSHIGEVDDVVGNFLFSTASSYIWFLLDRL